jgi:hypothetical protein
MSELRRWSRYWNEEPWGAHRDNIHAAMLAIELRRPQSKKGVKLKIDDFMWKLPDDPDQKKREVKARFFETLRARAVKK